MFEEHNCDFDICIVGRTDFSTGIGRHTYAFSELLSRHFKVCCLSTDGWQDDVYLPNGRKIKKWNGEAIPVAIYVDVIWNGVDDFKYTMVPSAPYSIACLVWDSDQLPNEWVEILNTRFDAAICLSPHLIETARRSGVTIPISCVPLALDLAPLLCEPIRKSTPRLRIGSVAAFHPRKNTTLLVDAFIEAFKGRDDVELLVHSNLAFPETLSSIRKRIEDENISNIIISASHLDDDAKNALVNTFDMFVNISRGEGYSIGPREALALGKVLVISNVGGHQELAGTPGVFLVEPEMQTAARYPEIDNRIFGTQYSVRLDRAVQALKEAEKYLRSPCANREIFDRKRRAEDFSFGHLSVPLASLFNPRLREFRKSQALTKDCRIGGDFDAKIGVPLISKNLLKTWRGRVVPMHDGGYFSIFNAFMSHLVWDLKEENCHQVLPDWDVSRFLERYRSEDILSFCYGNPGDGNIWTALYEPLFGLSRAAMQDEAVLYQNASPPDRVHNEHREPLLTYIHAARLYRAPWFQNLRRQYNRIYRQHIRLERSLQIEVDSFVQKNMAGYHVFGAHVRHPSHTVEQPNAVIAHADQYIQLIDEQVANEGFSKVGDKWRVFLATDQERVISRFKGAYGDRLIFCKNARRTTEKEDKVFDDLENKNVDGYQLQHLVSKNRQSWSLNMAREVIRDAYWMSECSSLLHVVSNVSTAVSYLNPECRMISLAS